MKRRTRYQHPETRAGRTQWPNRIREWRIKRRLTQEALGERAGFSKNNISTWESGRYEPTHWKLERIAAALNVAVADLLPESGSKGVLTPVLDEIYAEINRIPPQQHQVVLEMLRTLRRGLVGSESPSPRRRRQA